MLAQHRPAGGEQAHNHKAEIVPTQTEAYRGPHGGDFKPPRDLREGTPKPHAINALEHESERQLDLARIIRARKLAKAAVTQSIAIAVVNAAVAVE